MSVQCPNPPTGSDSASSWFRKLVKYVLSLELKSSPGVRVSRGVGGTTIEIQPSKGGVAGLKFAVPVEFDWINGSYSKDQIVIISPGSPACTVGVNESATSTHGTITGKDGTANATDESSKDVATAGMWACLQSPKVLSVTQPSNVNAPRNYDFHVPIWPPPSATDLETLNLTVVSGADTVDNPLNYWRLIGFVPIERIWCDADGPHPFYVQAVKAPVAP